MLSVDERAVFEELGFVRIRGAFSLDEAQRMRTAVWHELARRYGIDEHDPGSWTPKGPTGLKASKRHHAFEPIGGPALSTAADLLLGEWERPRQWGQVLVTFPDEHGPWVLPHQLWHVDFRYDIPIRAPLFGLKVFALFSDLGPRGGGTLLITRSHRLVARFLSDQSESVRRDFRQTRLRFMGHHPWLQELARPHTDPARTRRIMEQDTDINGISARVVELTGQAGDVVLTHPWVLHHVAPNTSDQPRFMRAQSLYRTRRRPSSGSEAAASSAPPTA